MKVHGQDFPSPSSFRGGAKLAVKFRSNHHYIVYWSGEFIVKGQCEGKHVFNSFKSLDTVKAFLRKFLTPTERLTHQR